jgi:polyadenylate-binding protein
MADQIPAYDTQPHPYLHEPRIYITNLPPWVSSEQLGFALQACIPFRPNITRDGSGAPLAGSIDFKVLHQGPSVRRMASAMARER